MLLTRREKVTGWLFIAPALCLVGLFVIWPTVQMIVASFFHVSWMQGLGAPAGAGNYEAVLEDPEFRQSLWNTGLFTVLVVPLQTGLALLFAVWVNRPGLSTRLLRICVFVPTTISLAVLSVIWDLMYQPATATGAGLFNGLLTSVGLPAQPFLTSTKQALPALVVMSVWQGVGLQMMVFLSGLQAIPGQLYEAAKLDGAGAWQRFVNVTLPQVAPTTVFVVMVTTIFALRLFVQPYLMTGGGPQGATRSVVQYVYEAAFHSRDLGLAFAAGSVFFLIVLGLTLLLRWLLGRAEVAE
jgi:ABC-type sugar transport system permease subunit